MANNIGNISYTNEQEKIIRSTSKRILVLSCAGSGKTLVITERISKLIKEGVNPSFILVLTFSNRATQEMSSRINLIEQNTRRMTIKTFHAFGLELIRNFSSDFGFSNSNVSIVKNSERKHLYNEFWQSEKSHANYHDEFFKEMSHRKNLEPHSSELDDVTFFRFNQFLHDQNKIDMDDMLYLPYVVLQNNLSLRIHIASKYKYIFVDEYQDTNDIQNKFLDLLTLDQTSICLVGDDDQAIYEFRGGRSDFIRNHAISTKFDCFYLSKNFRSQAAIIDVANAVISKNKSRVVKRIHPNLPSTQMPIYTRYRTEVDEANAVAEEIQNLINSKRFHPSDIAVLFKENRQSLRIQRALTERNIQFETNHSNQLNGYSKFISVLKSIADQLAFEEISAALNFPNHSMDQFIFQDAQVAYEKKHGLQGNLPLEEWFKLFNYSDIEFESCNEFRERYTFIKQLQLMVTWSPTKVIAAYLSYMESMGYSKEYTNDYRYVLQVFYIAQNYEASYGETVTLKEFIDHLTLTFERDEIYDSYEKDAVNLLTMHRAKGLEFKVVFIMGIQVGIFPRDFYINTELELEGERRLFYVAITRARELLFFSSYGDAFVGSKNNSIVKVGFMAEIPHISYTQTPLRYDFVRTLPEKEATPDILLAKEHKLMEIYGQEATTNFSDSLPFESEADITDLEGEDDENEVNHIDYKLNSAINRNLALAPDKFIVVLGKSNMKEHVLKAVLKANGISENQHVRYDYDGKPHFKLYNFENNSRCAGMIIGPVTHNLQGSSCENIIGKLQNNPDTYPFYVNLINQKITKKSLTKAVNDILLKNRESKLN